MPLRRTKRSDGRKRPRWKDGSHNLVESTPANASRCDGVALGPNPPTEPLVEVPQLLQRDHEHEFSTRDRPARAGADARIEESVAIGEVRLAILPYGRTNKRGFLGPTKTIRSNIRGCPRRGPTAGERFRAGSRRGYRCGRESPGNAGLDTCAGKKLFFVMSDGRR